MFKSLKSRFSDLERNSKGVRIVVYKSKGTDEEQVLERGYFSVYT
jgi:hypothetical protein